MPCRKHSSRYKEGRGAISALGKREAITEYGEEIERKMWPKVLITVLSGSGRYRKEFMEFMARHGLVYKRVENDLPFDAQELVYEVCGGPALMRIIETDYPPQWVVRWELCLQSQKPEFRTGKMVERGYVAVAS